MQFQDNLEIPGGNTRRQIKLEVELGYCSIEDKCLNLSVKWDQRRTIMVKTTIAKDQNNKMILKQGKNYYYKKIP